MGLYDSFAEEPISALALREPVLASPDDPCSDVVQQMRRRKLGCVIVVDHDRKPTGLFTEGMLTRLLVDRPAALGDPIGQRMSERLITVRQSDRVARVLDTMERENTRFVCVVDDEGRVAGLTGQKGLMEFVAEHFPQQVMVQRVGARPPQQREGA